MSISDANMKMSVAQWESTTYQGLKVRIRWLNSFELAAFETRSGLAGSSGESDRQLNVSEGPSWTASGFANSSARASKSVSARAASLARWAERRSVT